MAKSQAQATEQEQETPARKPVDKFHEGPVHVSIWENTGSNGPFRTASFQLRYKKDEEWQTGYSYGASDLRHLETAATEARARIERWQQQHRPKQTPTPSP